MAKSFKGRRLHGFQAGKQAISVYVCRGCEVHHKGKKPAQCFCGRMDFDRFDSVGEAMEWASLRLQEKRGVISGLDRQVRFPLMALGPNNLPVKVADYVADYVYFRDGKRIVADFKPDAGADPVFALKKRWLEAQGTEITVITEKGVYK